MSDVCLEESKKEIHSAEERLGQVEDLKESRKDSRSDEEQPGQVEDLKTPQEPTGTGESGKGEEEKKIHFIENPLPLPKPHKRKVMDFDINPGAEEWDFDYPVDENDDFDIK